MALLANLDLLPPEDAAKLARVGLVTTEDLLGRAGTKTARVELGAATGTDISVLDRLAATADLMRIAGLSEPVAQLLIALDTPSAAVLATRDAAVLVKQLRRKNVELLAARAIPPESTVARWIGDAAGLTPALET